METRSAYGDLDDYDALFAEGARLAAAGRDDEAERRFRPAADAGHVLAMYDLGHLLVRQRRREEAVGWWERVARAGYGRVLHDLGVLSQELGRFDEAERWYRLGAEDGATTAMINLGALLTDRGQKDEAARWYRQAADGGEIDAVYSLGVICYEAGDADEAEQCWRRAAESGHRDAMHNLGLLCRQQGRKREAERWWRRGSELGDVGAAHNLEILLAEKVSTDTGQFAALNGPGVLSGELGATPALADDFVHVLRPFVAAPADLPERAVQGAPEVLPGLVMTVGMHLGDRVDLMLPSSMAALGGPDAVRAVAVDNLAQLAPPLVAKVLADQSRPDSEIVVLRSDDPFGASRICDLPRLLAYAGEVEPARLGILVALPTWHLALIHVLRGPGAVSALQLMVEAASSEQEQAPRQMRVSRDVYFVAPDGRTQDVAHDDGKGGVLVHTGGPIGEVFFGPTGIHP